MTFFALKKVKLPPCLPGWGIEVRLHFRETPWDLILTFGYSIMAAITLLVVRPNDSTGLLFLFFPPGYVFVAALFPAGGRLEWLERIAFSAGCGPVALALLVFLLNLMSGGVSVSASILLTVFFTFGVGSLAYWRRRRLPTERRLSATIELAALTPQEHRLSIWFLTITLVAALAAASAGLLTILATPSPSDRFTEFYVLGPTGEASGYPTILNVSEPGSVILGVANREFATWSYTVRIDLVGVRIVHNATTGTNDTVEVNRTAWSVFNVTLVHGQIWTQQYTFQINQTGLWKIQFLLYLNGALRNAYREVHLFVRVS